MRRSFNQKEGTLPTIALLRTELNCVMETIDQFSFCILGFNILLFGLGVTNTMFTFRRKKSIPFVIIMFGFVCTLVSTMLSYAQNYWNPDSVMILVLADTFFYTQMVQYTLWSYYYRLKTIPKFNGFDKFAFCMPFFVALFQIPDAVIYNLNVRFDGYSDALQLTGALSGFAIIFCELFMYFVLVKKLLAFTENRSMKWLIKVTLTLAVVLIIDITQIVFYFTLPEVSGLFYSFSYFVRLNAVVLFFGDLVNFVKKGKTWRSYQNTPMLSEDSVRSSNSENELSIRQSSSFTNAKRWVIRSMSYGSMAAV